MRTIVAITGHAHRIRTIAATGFHCQEFRVTGDLTFEGITYEAAQDNTDVFVAAVADLCGVAASAVTVEISRPAAVASRRESW